MKCPECNGRGETIYYVETARDENSVTLNSRRGICRTCNGSGINRNTNADRIRAMTDEELADFFFESPEIEFSVCEYCKNFGGHTSDTPCKHDLGRCNVSDKNEAFKEWLQQPAEGE